MGIVDKIMIKFFLRSLLFVPALVFYIKDLKEYWLVYKDYKTQTKETKILFVRNQGYVKCTDSFNGAYSVLYCSEKQGMKCSEYWSYRKDLLYDETIHGGYYKVTYYKRSSCLYSVESISQASDNGLIDNISTPKIKNNQKPQKSISAAKNNMAKLKHKDESNVDLSDGKNRTIVTDIVTTIGIPTELQNRGAEKKFCLRVKNKNGKRIKLFFGSTDILGLGDLSVRPGYMGYGNFIGAEYEVEYYKLSHIVKSTKLISESANIL